MKREHLERFTAVFYFVLLTGFVLFGVYMFFFEHNQVYSARDFGSFSILQPDGDQIIADASAPVGVRREFSLTIPEYDSRNNCLSFYLVHDYAQVWFDDELVYSLSPGADNRIGGSPSSNWILIPILPTDSGRAVTILLTPVYESVVNRKIEFFLGSHAAILAAKSKADFPELTLSALCILIGFVLIGAQILMMGYRKISDAELLYLGVFTLLIGIWRITDIRFTPILFPQNPMALGYITIGALFLAVTPILLYMKAFYLGSEKLILHTALVISGASAVVLLCEVFGVAEFKQLLFVSHISIIVALVMLFVSIVRRAVTGTSQPGIWKCLLFLALSAAIDLLRYYIQGSSAGILCTIFALVVFCVYRLVFSILRVNRRAYTDVRTGLFNKNRWDELMKGLYKKSDTIGIIMMDLNHLKYVNDTKGHEAGDKLILNFANILRNTIPPSNTICRWGGDEFAILITNASREKMERYVNAIAEAVKNYNASGEIPQIHYAAGWALSSEFPDLSPSRLFEEADKRMYLDKKQWYADNVRTN